MAKPDFLNHRLPHLDKPLLPQLKGVSFRPVFIMGLHRSGTTFLYETLYKLLPVTALRVYDLVFYPRLLHNELENRSAVDQDALDAYFASLHLETRPTDNMALSHAALEEYGWLLLRYLGKTRIHEKTAPFVTEIAAKLMFLQPTAQAVLMKSPFDAGQGPDIYRCFPKARFIYIHRNPMEILNSQFKNAILFGSVGDPFLMLLMAGIPLARLVIRAQQVLYRLVGEKQYRKIMLHYLIRDVAREWRRCHETALQLPSEVVYRLDYADLLADPQGRLQDIADFLELPVTGDLTCIKAESRNLKLFPEIEARQEELLQTYFRGAIP